ncbi:MAG: hybrid sensor histidine kinase/response regulator [Nitrosopumilus sp.]|nr:hybrid sensor histidine kinase/response regulator [Nitrosopumilus sp.]
MSDLIDNSIITDAREVMAIFPTVDSVLASNNFSLIQNLMNIMENITRRSGGEENNIDNNNPMIRIIIPYDKTLDKIIQKFKQNKDSFVHYISEIKDIHVDKAIFIIVNRTISLVVKINEYDDKINVDTYNNKNILPNPESISLYNKYDNNVSSSVVFSHISAFEILWRQSEANDELENNDQIKEDFINICAHELRSPIQPILGLSILVKNKITDTNQREILDVIIRNAKRLKKLADDLLEATKIESNSIKIEKEKFNLNDFINEVLCDYANKISKEDFNNNYTLNIVKFIPQDIIFFVDVDKDKLIQVIHNILNNAIRASSPSDFIGNSDDIEPIHFSLEKITKNQVQFSIKDGGPGIDAQILPKLFTKFITKSGKGIGLGLFIAKSIIEAHGGKMWAENNKGGKGATFYFTLPVIMQSQKNLEIKKILVVYDNQNFTMSLKTNFEAHGKYIVDIFDNPSTALQKFVSGYYDFVILDIDMPEIDGFDLSQKLRKKDDKVEVVFLTSGGTNYEPLRELYGISEKNHFIKKTLNTEKIIMQIDNLNVNK